MTNIQILIQNDFEFEIARKGRCKYVGAKTLAWQCRTKMSRVFFGAAESTRQSRRDNLSFSFTKIQGFIIIIIKCICEFIHVGIYICVCVCAYECVCVCVYTYIHI